MFDSRFNRVVGVERGESFIYTSMKVSLRNLLNLLAVLSKVPENQRRVSPSSTFCRREDLVDLGKQMRGLFGTQLT